MHHSHPACTVPNRHSLQGEFVILAAEPLCVCGCDVVAPREGRRPGGREEPLADWLRCFEEQLTAREWEAVRGAGDEAAQEVRFRWGRRGQRAAPCMCGGGSRRQAGLG